MGKIDVAKTLDELDAIFIALEELVKELDKLNQLELANALRFLLPSKGGVNAEDK